MSLPSKAIDRLFERLALTYGRQFTDLYSSVDPGAVKSLWAHELDGFSNGLHRIAWALDNLPARCPNVIEFKNLCRQAPTPETPRLPEPAHADPERVKAELAKLAPVRQSITDTPSSREQRGEWAIRILQRAKDGAKISPTVLQMAREGLKNLGISFA